MVNFEQALILNRYFLNLFKTNNFNTLRSHFQNQSEENFVNTLIELNPDLEEQLLRYDASIKQYVKQLKQYRGQSYFSLKYFQYLAVLFTEMFLEQYYHNKQAFIDDLNKFVMQCSNDQHLLPFTEKDLQKLAFWMATGSGKTILMHINYMQILKYTNNWDNIILITPNEDLSKQHYAELKLSGIPCTLYDGNTNNIKTSGQKILIIDIHKLTKGKRGQGVSVDIEYFDGKNLIFIDEGHKGQVSEEQKWKNLREELGKDGFIFEYSATFGQIMNNDNSLMEEYSKAIIFDYSYKYFYSDGYGKDFYVYNVKAEKKNNKIAYSEEQQSLLLTAGLLSLYEQIELFETYKEDVRAYNIEKPLWMFVGSKVAGKNLNSDIMTIVKFLYKITKEPAYLEANINKILTGQSQLKTEEGNDIFAGQFKYIKQQNIKNIIQNIYQKVFGGQGELQLHEIKSSTGEIGLKTSNAKNYFGIINIGDINAIKSLIEEAKIPLYSDHLTQSLFSNINKQDSIINILIGAKKFIEGWNSWRVSTMGLINMGKGEGTQIIQLFGRGVRLKGYNYSLKREINPSYPVKILQTLFVFGLNADYINTFLTTIEQEGIKYSNKSVLNSYCDTVIQEHRVHANIHNINNSLTKPIFLVKDDNILKQIKINLSPKATMAHGMNIKNANISTNTSAHIPEEYLDIIDWNYILCEMMNYKIANDMYSLVIDKNEIIKIIKSNQFSLFLNNTEGIQLQNNNGKIVLTITTFEGVKKLHEIVISILEKYAKTFYREKTATV